MKDKILKIIIGAIIAVILIVLIVVVVTKVTEKKPAASLEAFVEALNVADYDTAEAYTSDETFDALGISEDTEDMEMLALYFKYIEVDILEVTKSDSQAVITAQITNKNLGTIWQNYYTKAQELALSALSSSSDEGETSMEEELREYFNSQFESEEIDTVTTEVEIIMNKVEGEWKVVVDEALRDALLPGLSELTNLFSNATA